MTAQRTWTAQRTCGWCGVTMSQRALYLTDDYGAGADWRCRSARQCARRWTERVERARADRELT